MFMKHGIAIGAILAVGLAAPAMARVDGDTITLGSSISLTGKYATNGLHTQRGYDYAVKVINEAGGVKVGDKSYKLAVKYYDDESTPARGAQLAERLIQQDGVEYMLGPYSSGMTKAIAPVSEKFGVPMVEAEGASLARSLLRVTNTCLPSCQRQISIWQLQLRWLQQSRLTQKASVSRWPLKVTRFLWTFVQV